MSIRKILSAALLITGMVASTIQATTVVTFHPIQATDDLFVPIKISPNGQYIAGAMMFGQNAASFSVATNTIKTWGEGSLWDATNNGKFCGELRNPQRANAFEAGYASNPTASFNFIGNVNNYAPTDDSYSSAYDMTPDGNTIVGMGFSDISSATAFKWTEAQGFTALNSSTTLSSCAYMTSSDGQTIVGWQETPNEVRNPTIWKNGVQITVPESLEGWGWYSSVSSDGSTVAGNFGGGMVRWTEATGMQNLGCLPDDWDAEGTAIADNGMIVGFSNMMGNHTAVVWTAANGLQRFDTYLTSLGATIPAGWQFMQISSVTPDGKYFIGYGVDESYNPFGWYILVDDDSNIAESSSTPVTGSLTGNYPNPFNPSTTIGFTLNKQAAVKMVITNSNGQLVKEAALGSLAFGSHEYKFDGEKLNSGIYFCNLIIDGVKSGSHKMVLTK